MPPPAIKLIWSISSCNFCPRSDVRTCKIKPGKLLSKLSSALDLQESILDSSEGICTCCLADIDMIIRAVAIRGAMKDYFMDVVQNLQNGYNPTINNNGGSYLNGHYQSETVVKKASTDDGQQIKPNASYTTTSQHEIHLEQTSLLAPPPPSLVARPALSRDCLPELVDNNLPTLLGASTELTTTPAPVPPPPSTKKTKERLTRYQCILCDKIAGSKSHCMEHLICHSPVRPFTCSHCMKTYKSRKACREHLIVMHGVEKIEENLQRLVLVDHEGLKQLQDVCTQYKRIYNRSVAKPAFDSLGSPTTISSFKVEVKEPKFESDGGSAWLYKPLDVTSRLPPPLLQCLPSTMLEAILPSKKSPTFEVIAPPPSKRTRKGTPHKLINTSTIHDSTVEEFPEAGAIPDIFIPDHIEGPNDCGNNINDYSNKWHTIDNSDCEQLSFHGSTDDSYDSEMKQSYFPSFQTYKTEAPFSTVNRQSPYSPNSGSKRMTPPCHICSRSFPTKEKMADHMRSHSEIKQFSCLVCNRFFKYRRGVTNHLKEVHHMTDKSEIGTKVASHEEGCIIPKYRRSKERKIKTENSEIEIHPCDTNISEKVIQDTLSSLVDIQIAADSTLIPALSSDESMGDADNSTPLPDDQSLQSDNPIPHKSTLSEILGHENSPMIVTNSNVTNGAISSGTGLQLAVTKDFTPPKADGQSASTDFPVTDFQM